MLTYEAGREIAVRFPDLDVATSGEKEQAALCSTRRLLDCALHGLKAGGKPVPEPAALETLSLT